ncbi:MAG: hypothetical protein HUJ25_00055 [Crocinitomicaceae bacterium]|nr:hypothetical protein [Crocinitomicaceae bacterium]
MSTINPILIFIAVLLVACSQGSSSENETTSEETIIQIGPYQFDFPSEFALVTEKGIDSNVGKIESDSITLRFDYGHYSNKLILSIDEYLSSYSWEMDLHNRFSKPEDIDYTKSPPEVEIFEVREATETDSSFGFLPDYIVTFEYEENKYSEPIFISEENKNHKLRVDTIKNHFRKIVQADNPETGVTGIYLSDYQNVNTNIGTPKSLSMSTTGISRSQQDLLIRVFESVAVVEN